MPSAASPSEPPIWHELLSRPQAAPISRGATPTVETTVRQSMASTTNPARTRYSACGRSASFTMITLCPVTTPAAGAMPSAPSGK